MKKYFVVVTTAILAAIIFSACGFQLRGKIELPPEMSSVYIQSTNLRLAGRLGRALNTSGASIVSDRKKASAILTIYQIKNSRGVRSVGGTGRVREFSLTYQVDFGIKDASGKVLMKRQSASLVREFSFNEAQVVGKSVEEAIIKDEMSRQMISELLRRVQRNFRSQQRQKTATSQ